MGWGRQVRHGWFELVSAAEKLVWGARTVGALPAAVGVVRLISLRIRTPPRARVRLRSGAELEFAVPGQVAPALVLFRDLIDPEFAFLREVSHPDWVVLDVGAAIGQFSVFAARLPAARVHAFEPSPANLVTLHRNLELNGIADTVVVHTIALGDRDGEATFSTADNTYLSGLVEPGQEVEHSVTVPVRRLADVVTELGITRVDVLKLNVAGYEPGVLAGAGSWLEGGGADILVLLIGDESRPWYERCVAWGYRFFFYHPKDRRLFPVTAFDQHSLRHPVWPARHLIGVHEGAIHRGVLDGVEIAEPTPSGRR